MCASSERRGRLGEVRHSARGHARCATRPAPAHLPPPWIPAAGHCQRGRRRRRRRLRAHRHQTQAEHCARRPAHRMQTLAAHSEATRSCLRCRSSRLRSRAPQRFGRYAPDAPCDMGWSLRPRRLPAAGHRAGVSQAAAADAAAKQCVYVCARTRAHARARTHARGSRTARVRACRCDARGGAASGDARHDAGGPSRIVRRATGVRPPGPARVAPALSKILPARSALSCCTRGASTTQPRRLFAPRTELVEFVGATLRPAS